MARKGEGQTALITGASTGIGADLAECFAKDGYDLIVVARAEGALNQVASRLADKYRVKAIVIAQDLGVPGSGERLAAEIAARELAVDVLVNNAGFGATGAFAGSDRAAQLGMIDLNDRVLVELTHIYWPRMIANRKGGVLNVASVAAFQPGPLMAIYYASKAFVLSFSEALWKEAQGTGVHVSCLCPGPTVSNFHGRAGTDKTKLFALGAMASMTVAKMGYRGFRKNRRVVITGISNAIMARSVPFTPRRLLLSIVNGLQSQK